MLRHFDRQPVTINLLRQSRWAAPRRVEKEYPVGATEDTGAKTFLTLNWLIGDALDPATYTAWHVLELILLGNEAAPLKKALIDSKLGADVFLAGTDNPGHEFTFHVGLKGSEVDRAEKFEKLVLDTLREIAGTPLAADRVAAAFQQLAYQTLEVKTLFPLHLLYGSNYTWPFNGDPLTYLRMSDHLAACRQRYAADPEIFNKLIKTGLLKNHHRLLAVVRPDREIQARRDAAFAKQMTDRRAQFTGEQIAAIAKTAAELEAAQGVPNSPEALAKLPQLKASDLPAKPRHIPTMAGAIVVAFTDKGASDKVEIPYGKKADGFYLSSMTEEQVGPAVPRSHQFGISVGGTAAPRAATFTGFYIVTVKGKDVRKEFSGQAGLTRQVTADAVRYCEVRKTSADGSIYLLITSDGKTLYESPATETGTPITYSGTR